MRKPNKGDSSNAANPEVGEKLGEKEKREKGEGDSRSQQKRIAAMKGEPYPMSGAESKGAAGMNEQPIPERLWCSYPDCHCDRENDGVCEFLHPPKRAVAANSTATQGLQTGQEGAAEEER